MNGAYSPARRGDRPRGPAARLKAVAAPLAVGIAALAFAGTAISLAAEHPKFLLWGPAHAVGVLCIVFGLAVWVRHPEAARVGWLLLAMGVSWYFADLQISAGPVLFRLGFWLSDLNVALVAQILFADPDGRLPHRAERLLVAGIYATVLVTQGMRILVERPLLAQLWGGSNPHLSLWAQLGGGIGLALTAIGLVLVVRRWRREPRPARRARTPVWAAGAIVIVALAALLAAGLAQALPQVLDYLLPSYSAALLLLGIALLAGVLRGSVATWGRLELLLERTRPGAGRPRPDALPDALRDALRDALEDPGLTLHLWSAETRQYLDSGGGLAPLPTPGGDRVVTRVDGSDHLPLAALVHDPGLTARPELSKRLDMVLDVAALALENARLHAESQALLRRLLDLEHDFRDRFQMMLHDGVQHRLSAIQLQLGQVRTCISETRRTRLLARIAADLQDVVQEVRDVAAGAFPAMLRDYGLAVALDSLAQRSTVPLLVQVEDRRWPLQVEVTAFFAISEAVGNAQQHARASQITVRVRSTGNGNSMRVDVSDDGAGGATFKDHAGHDGDGRGSGLRRMRDRVKALGGTFDFDSPPGQGTTIWAILPAA